MKYRVGTKVGRTIYQNDVLIGLMDTRELAREAVDAMNSAEAVTAELRALREAAREVLGNACLVYKPLLKKLKALVERAGAEG